MRPLACALLVLALAVPARALDDDDDADVGTGEAAKRLRAIDEATERDADQPEAAGEEPDEHDPVDAELEPRDPYDDGETTDPAPPARRDAQRPAPAKPPRYPNVLEPAPSPSSGKAATDGKNAPARSLSSPDAAD